MPARSIPKYVQFEPLSIFVTLHINKYEIVFEFSETSLFIEQEQEFETI